MPIYLLLLLFPLLEIVVFFAVADEIGLLTSFALLLTGMVAGGALLSWQGSATLEEMRHIMSGGRAKAGSLSGTVFDALCITFASILLIVPGFISDFFAIILLVPPVRRAMRRGLDDGKTHTPPEIIEGDFEIITPPDPANDLPENKP